ncbi:hypothetical protein GCM10017744_080690 [Streptomyces antimycoticus]
MVRRVRLTLFLPLGRRPRLPHCSSPREAPAPHRAVPPPEAPAPANDIPESQRYLDTPPGRVRTRVSCQTLEVRGSPSKPRVLPTPKAAPLGLRELINPTSGAGDAPAGRP